MRGARARVAPGADFDTPTRGTAAFLNSAQPARSMPLLSSAPLNLGFSRDHNAAAAASHFRRPRGREEGEGLDDAKRESSLITISYAASWRIAPGRDAAADSWRAA